MSELDALLARSKAPGAMTRRRSFTLARSKAIEKMRSFSLADADQCVLELFQAAVFAEARWVGVEVSSTRLVVGWVGGKVVRAHELETLFDHLFTDQARAETRHLHQLAVAVNTSQQWRPALVRVESGSHTGSHRLELASGGEVTTGSSSEALEGSYVAVEFGRGMGSFFSGRKRAARLVELVETRARYSPIPVLLNDDAPFGYGTRRAIRLPFAEKSVEVKGPGVRGVLALDPTGSGGVRIVVGGVWVCTRELHELGPSLVGVLCDDRLRKTADLSDVARDATWYRMLREVQPFATQLQKWRDRDFSEMKLPKEEVQLEDEVIVEVPVEPEVQPTDVVFPVRQLGPRPPLALDELCAFRPGTTAFWVSPEDAPSLQPSVPVTRFPFPVLELEPGQALRLEELAPDVVLSRLRSAEDARFVTGMRSRTRSSRSLPLTVAVDETTRSLVLHYLGEGEAFAWTGRARGVPVVDKEHLLGHLPVQLQGALVEVADAELDAFHWSEDWAREATTAVTTAAFALMELPTAPDAAVAPFVVDLIAANLRQWFVADGDRYRLEVELPSAWGPLADELLDAPLVMAEEGPVTVRSLVALAGTRRCLTLRSEEDFARLGPLRELHRGHLLVAHRTAAPLAYVVFSDGRARVVEGPLGSFFGVDAMLVLRPDLGPEKRPGWRRVEHDVRFVEAWVFGDGELDAITLRIGFEALQSYVEAWLIRWLPDAEGASSTARLTIADRVALLRVVRASLVNALGGRASVLNGQGRRRRLHGDGSASLVAPGVQVADGTDVVAVSFDELVALAEGAAAPTLLVDDAPTVWRSQFEEADRWLVREGYAAGALVGWVGLRAPFDQTTAVLLMSADAVVHVDVSPELPCHGVLRASTPVGTLSPEERRELRLAKRRLYRRLADRMRERLSVEEREAAMAYAAQAVAMAWEGAPLEGLMATLADAVQIGTWGTLGDWLLAEPDERPELPVAFPHRKLVAVQQVSATSRRTGAAAPDAQRLLDAAIREQVSGFRLSLDITHDARKTGATATFREGLSMIAVQLLLPSSGAWSGKPAHVAYLQAVAAAPTLVEALCDAGVDVDLRGVLDSLAGFQMA